MNSLPQYLTLLRSFDAALCTFATFVFTRW